MDQLKKVESRLIKVESRLINLQLHILTLKNPLGQHLDKGQLVDMEYAIEATGMNISQLQNAIKQNKIPIYFFKDDIEAFTASNKTEEVSHG